MSKLLALLAVLLVLAMVICGQLFLRPPMPTPTHTATASIPATATSIPTIKPPPTLTPTTPPTATAFPTPDPEQGWVEIYANQVWIRQISPTQDGELPCLFTWFRGQGCAGETLEVVTSLEGYYLNVWVRNTEGKLDPVQSIPLIPGEIVTVEIPQPGVVGFGTMPAK